MELLTTTYSTKHNGSKSRSISFINGGSLAVDENARVSVSSMSMNAEQFLLWQMQGRKLRVLCNNVFLFFY